MQLKTTKNNRGNAASGLRKRIVTCAVWLVLLVSFLAPTLTPEPAAAYNFYQPVVVDGSGTICPGYGLTRRVVPCIKETMVYTVSNFVGPFSNYLGDAIALLCVLAIAILGVKMTAGVQDAPKRELALLAVKIAFVGYFTFEVDTIFGLLLDIMDDVLNSITLYAINVGAFANILQCNIPGGDSNVLAIWDLVDCTIERLVGGIFSPFNLALGIIGFLFACLFSGGVGLFIAMLGFYLVCTCLMAIARSLYIFLSSYIAFAIMMIIAPIFIPMVLFKSGAVKGYFDKWLRLTFSFMIQPVVLFVYLSLMLAAFNAAVFTGPTSLYYAIAGNASTNNNFNLGNWIMSAGGYSAASTGGQAVSIHSYKATQATGVPTAKDTGITGNMGAVGQQFANTIDDWQFAIYEAMGLGNTIDPLTGEPNLNFFKVDIPGTGIDWNLMSCVVTGNCNQNSVIFYIIRVLLSAIMAVVTAYIFLTMLNQLPYVSGVLSGAPDSIPKFGIGKMAMPGGNVMSSFKKGMSGFLQGGGAKT